MIEREFCALLEQYPTAPLVAVNANGLVADMPDSVPRNENPVLKGRSSLDGVPAEEHGRLIAAFDTLLTHGMAQCVLHPPGYAEVTWHGFDLRGRHGVIVGVITAEGEVSTAAAAVDARDMVRAGPPRFATISKNERSFIVGVSGAMSEILGWSTNELLGRRSLDLVHPDDQPLAIDNWMEMLADSRAQQEGQAAPQTQGRVVGLVRDYEQQPPQRPGSQLRGRRDGRHLG